VLSNQPQCATGSQVREPRCAFVVLFLPACGPEPHVVKRAQPAIAVDCDQDRCSSDLRRHEIARPAELLNVSHVLHAAPQSSVPLAATTMFPIDSTLEHKPMAITKRAVIFNRRPSPLRFLLIKTARKRHWCANALPTGSVKCDTFGAWWVVALYRGRTCQVLRNTLSCSRAKASAAVYQLGGGTLACASAHRWSSGYSGRYSPLRESRYHMATGWHQAVTSS